MRERIELSFRDDPEAVVLWFEGQGLASKEMGTEQYRGGRHWHFSKAGEKGVIELTWHPAGAAMWIDVRANRRGAWVDDVLNEAKARFGE